jgi:hypothetical protein
MTALAIQASDAGMVRSTGHLARMTFGDRSLERRRRCSTASGAADRACMQGRRTRGLSPRWRIRSKVRRQVMALPASRSRPGRREVAAACRRRNALRLSTASLSRVDREGRALIAQLL